MIGRWRGRIQNSQNNSQKIHKMSTLTLPKSSLKNAIKAGFFLTVILNHLTLVLIWGRESVFNPYTGGASC